MTADRRTGMDVLDPDECWALLRRAPVGRLATSIASHPATHVFPICRATTAAWDVIPPFAVRIPRATSIPWMSSGLPCVCRRLLSFPFVPD